MASVSQMPPPPGSAPMTTGIASPAPATPSPQMQQGTQAAIQVVNLLRGIAKAFPGTSPKISEINNLMREVTALMMQHQEPGEPQAPPSGG